MPSEKNPRYDVKTKSESSWNPITQFVEGTKQVTTIRDNTTGKEHKGSGKTAEQSRDNTWKRVNEE
ncbi:hypothetical protein QT972_03630 [Microcoleus sp. herbarium7]|uniref:hypothetical protein n=1 Tax=Microcoleus sp. herbarium7 TaxID=3055435 RepID=UPI002FD4BEE8